MKTPVASFLLFLTIGLTSCIGRVIVDKSGEYKLAKENYSFIQEYESPNDIHLTLGTTGGNIQVDGYDGNRVKVAFIVTKSNGDVLEMTLEELKKYASYVITKEGANLTIQIKEIFKNNMSVSFLVQTPVKTTCSVTTSGGNLELNNLNGFQELNTSGGNIDIEKITGNVEAHTSGGNISMEKLTGNLKVSTSGGNIGGEKIKGELYAETSGGNIGLEGMSGIAEVSTSGGNIDVENSDGALSARTSGGNVSAELNEMNGKLFLETNGGDIDCELPASVGMNLNLDAAAIHTTLTNFQGTNTPESISGKIHGGGIPVHLSCPSGSIRLKFNKSSDNQ